MCCACVWCASVWDRPDSCYHSSAVHQNPSHIILTLSQPVLVCKSQLKNSWYKQTATHLSFPNIGESPMMTEARADLTCWFASDTRSLIHGSMLVIITVSRTSGARFWQKSVGNMKDIHKIQILYIYMWMRSQKPWLLVAAKSLLD